MSSYAPDPASPRQQHQPGGAMPGNFPAMFPLQPRPNVLGQGTPRRPNPLANVTPPRPAPATAEGVMQQAQQKAGEARCGRAPLGAAGRRDVAGEADVRPQLGADAGPVTRGGAKKAGMCAALGKLAGELGSVVQGRGGAVCGQGGVISGRGGAISGRGGASLGRGGASLGRGGASLGRGGASSGWGEGPSVSDRPHVASPHAARLSYFRKTADSAAPNPADMPPASPSADPAAPPPADGSQPPPGGAEAGTPGAPQGPPPDPLLQPTPGGVLPPVPLPANPPLNPPRPRDPQDDLRDATMASLFEQRARAGDPAEDARFDLMGMGKFAHQVREKRALGPEVLVPLVIGGGETAADTAAQAINNPDHPRRSALRALVAGLGTTAGMTGGAYLGNRTGARYGGLAGTALGALAGGIAGAGASRVLVPGGGKEKEARDAGRRTRAKAAAQDNSGPRYSATGRSTGLTYNHKPDHYAQGQEAWASISGYFKGGGGKRPDPFLMQHAGDEGPGAAMLSPHHVLHGADHTSHALSRLLRRLTSKGVVKKVLSSPKAAGDRALDSAPAAAAVTPPPPGSFPAERVVAGGRPAGPGPAEGIGPLTPFAEGFFRRCESEGLGRDATKAAMDRLAAALPAVAADELRAGWEKVAAMPRIDPAAAWRAGKSFLGGLVRGGSRQAAGAQQAFLPGMEALRRGAGRAAGAATASGPATQAFLPGMAPRPGVWDMAGKAWNAAGTALHRAGPSVGGALAGGFSGDSMGMPGTVETPGGFHFSPLGAAMGGLAFSRGMRRAAGNGWGNVPLNAVRRGIAGDLAGVGVDTAAGAVGVDTDGGFARAGARLGMLGGGLQAAGRRLSGPMLGAGQGTMARGLQQYAGKANRFMTNFGSGASDALMSGAAYVPRAAHDLVRHGRMPASFFMGRGGNAATRLGRMVGGAGAAVGLAGTAGGAAADYLGRRADEFVADRYRQMAPVVQQDVAGFADDYLSRRGLLNQEGQFDPTGSVINGLSSRIGGYLGDAAGGIGAAAGQLGTLMRGPQPQQPMPQQPMQPRQPWLQQPQPQQPWGDMPPSAQHAQGPAQETPWGLPHDVRGVNQPGYRNEFAHQLQLQHGGPS